MQMRLKRNISCHIDSGYFFLGCHWLYEAQINSILDKEIFAGLESYLSGRLLLFCGCLFASSITHIIYSGFHCILCAKPKKRTVLCPLSADHVPLLRQDLGYACCWPFLFYLGLLQNVQNNQLLLGICYITATEEHRIASRSTCLSGGIRQTDPAYYASMMGYLDLRVGRGWPE